MIEHYKNGNEPTLLIVDADYSIFREVIHLDKLSKEDFILRYPLTPEEVEIIFKYYQDNETR
ncbi:MAG: hypothetical protein IPN33_25470 [Saprospiraceae bacterium]|nr:hypothetical protein [Saprospiraceae bacterium]